MHCKSESNIGNIEGHLCNKFKIILIYQMTYNLAILA